jgi:Ni2+-binding GTPase involved in maturation of urease and hydrogenase
MRPNSPWSLCNLKTGEGVDSVIEALEGELKIAE